MKWVIAIPVLNEEEQLRSKLTELVSFIRQSGFNFVRVVVADNGSTDSTPRIASELANEFEEVSSIRLNCRGVGLALKTAWKVEDATHVGFMDLDLATDLSHLQDVLRAIEQSDPDLVVGSRLKRGASVRNRSLIRSLTSRVFNTVVRTKLGVDFSDGMCGFKFAKKAWFDKASSLFKFSDGWFFSTELLVAAQWMRGNIVELPVQWTDDRRSKVRLVRTSMEHLRAINDFKEQRKKIG